MGIAIKHPVPDRVKSSFVMFDIRALWCSAECQSVRMSKIINDSSLTRFAIGECFIAVSIWQQWAQRVNVKDLNSWGWGRVHPPAFQWLTQNYRSRLVMYKETQICMMFNSSFYCCYWFSVFSSVSIHGPLCTGLLLRNFSLALYKFFFVC